ncbi:MAG: hypothetical protein NTY36_06585 [Deltaproteobacteria bacterium]|nr:hypothetical protein [Deltaproteobacteria bacterium]
MKDDEIIESFVTYLRDNGYPNLRIDRRPDKENRQSKDIDAIAGPFAIEHTLISTFQNQKAQDDWFTKAMAKLESELPTPPYELVICSEYDAVKKGQDWAGILNALKTWITQEAPQLEDGEYDFDSLPGIPFRLRIEKSSNGSPGIFFIRRLPENNDSLQLRIYNHLTSLEKIQKLFPYKRDGFTTVLLIEGNLTRNKMLHAIKLAFPDGLHPDLNEIWYVSTWGNHIAKFTKLPKWGGKKK